MADSDEELDRRRNREKFRRERSDHDGKRRPGDKREPFDDRVTLPNLSNSVAITGNNATNYTRGERRPYNNSTIPSRERLSPGREPPYKRPRRDWNDDSNRSSYRRRDNRQTGLATGDTANCSEFDQACFRAPLMLFKRFMEPLDDFISMEDACDKYRGYRTALAKKQIEDFFEAHKPEEWLREKYHPDYAESRKSTEEASVRHRLSVFTELFHKGYIDGQRVQMDNSEALIKLMDTVVILLEGGDDEDLRVLEEDERRRRGESPSKYGSDASDDEVDRSGGNYKHRGSSAHSEEGEAVDDSDLEDAEPDDNQHSSHKEEAREESSPVTLKTEVDNALTLRSRRPNRTSSGSSSPLSDSSNGEQPSNHETDDDEKLVKPCKSEESVDFAFDCGFKAAGETCLNDQLSTHAQPDQLIKHSDDEGEHARKIDSEDEEDDDVPTPTTAEVPGCVSTVSAAASVTDKLLKSTPLVNDGDPSDLHHSGSIQDIKPGLSQNSDISLMSTCNSEAKDAPQSWNSELNGSESGCKTKPTGECKTVDKKPRRHLHKTTSIFFRSILPSITRAELTELCSSQPGFIRLAMWDPVPERRFSRHAWATYQPDVNIKKICWALNTSQALRDRLSTSLPTGCGDLGATVNRDLAQRVRPLTPLTRHKPVMRQDLIFAARLVLMLDARLGLWQGSQTAQQISVPGLREPAISANPLLDGITDHLVDEGGAEEEALISETASHPAENSENADSTDGPARGSTASKTTSTVVLESDPDLARALDRLIIYLRIVYSVDFYSASIYPMEDAMPHRCGILHARGDRGLNPPPGGTGTPGSFSSAGARSLAMGGKQVGGLVFTTREVDEYIKNFAAKMSLLLDVPPNLNEEEMIELGKRDPDKAGEDFIESNIQKRTSKKKPFKVVWVCPLSDKKFREPIFVRKHILNKHAEKIEAARKDNAVFFNAYLKDPRRPCLPEAPQAGFFPGSGVGGTSVPSKVGLPAGSAGVGSSGANQRAYSGAGGNNRGGTSTGSNSAGGYRTGGMSGNTNFRTAGSAANSLLSNPYPGSRGVGGFQDLYDAAAVAAQQQQAMAAMAAAAAALYPNAGQSAAAAASDFYALAAAAAGATGGSGSSSISAARKQGYAAGAGGRSRSPILLGDRYSNLRFYNGSSGPNVGRRRGVYGAGDRPRYGAGGGRHVVSYTDLDDPSND